MAVETIGVAGDDGANEGVDTVAVGVSDRGKALAWYRAVLGLEATYVAPDVEHWIELGPARPRTRIHMCELPGEVEPGPTGVTPLTRDLHAEYERLRGLGVSFRDAPRKESWAEWLCAFVDPSGNGFDFKHPVDPSEWKA